MRDDQSHTRTGITRITTETIEQITQYESSFHPRKRCPHRGRKYPWSTNEVIRYLLVILLIVAILLSMLTRGSVSTRPPLT